MTKHGLPFLMVGGGTGGHVIPALAVAQELRRRGHQPFFIGTKQGLEAKLVPEAGFPMEWVAIGGLKRVGLVQTAKTLCQLPLGILQLRKVIAQRRPPALFSMGGYVAGPAVLAAWTSGVPIVLMEPNAVPGFTNRHAGRMASKALVSFEETARHFPPGRAEVTGLPIRSEFFSLPEKPSEETLSVLITGGSRGSRTLNQASRQSWPLFRNAGRRIRILHQTGAGSHEELRREFESSGLEGEVVPFIQDMPGAFAAADLIVCRSGAGAVAELAAAGKASILVPFPFAADQHQLHNAEALSRAGAARLVLDSEMNGERLYREITMLADEPDRLRKMGQAARTFARPGAATRAADLLEELAARGR